MKTGPKILLLLIAAAVLSTGVLSVLAAPETGVRGELRRALGVDVGSAPALRDEDSHGGFHGDGERKIAVDCSDIRDEVLAQTASWSSLPLPGVLAQAAELSGSGLIPDGLTQGRYLFLDRHSEAADPRDPGPLFHRASFNFTLSVYDAVSDILYYYELDT